MQKKSKKQPDIEILNALPIQVDVLLLKDQFSMYKNPQKKIFDLTQKEYLYPIKRGRYFNLKSEDLKKTQLESMANVLYFPSYVSAEWALQYYGLLMDRVHTVTSVTTRRTAQFKTPMGIFSFEHINKRRYPCGYVMQTSAEKSFLIARPEKALLDFINLRVKKISWKTKTDIFKFLVEDFRIDLKSLFNLVKNEELRELLPYYHRNSKEARLLKWLITQQKEQANGSPH